MGYSRVFIEVESRSPKGADGGCGQSRIELWKREDGGQPVYDYKVRLTVGGGTPCHEGKVFLISVETERCRRYFLGTVAFDAQGRTDSTLRGAVAGSSEEGLDIEAFRVFVIEDGIRSLQGFRGVPIDWRRLTEEDEEESRNPMEPLPESEPPVPPDEEPPAPDSKVEPEERFRRYRTVYPFHDRSRKWVRLQPEDLRFLPPEAQSLSKCPFVQRACYRYGHLILSEEKGTDPSDAVRFTIGVPYRYLPALGEEAKCQHFHTFRNSRGTEAGYGEYGYWLRDF